MIINDYAIKLMEQGALADFIVRAGIRRVCKMRIDEFQSLDIETRQLRVETFVEQLANSPIAILPEKANEQHYEVPAGFYKYALGKNLKYSSAYWRPGVTNLDQAEDDMLALTASHADIADGMEILELGCGWGSLTLWLARNFPNSKIIAVSNSSSQREHILQQAASRNLKNIQVVTADMNTFNTQDKFDRVVSVEMFEHMRNYKLLMNKINSWLKPNGKLFIHIFCHREYAYPYETEGSDNWMGRYFFSGGIMPSVNLLSRFSNDLHIERQWNLSGTHYEKTANAWLANIDNQKADILGLFVRIYNKKLATIWFNRWRVFFMACAELFGYQGGDQWFVTHILFSRKSEQV